MSDDTAPFLLATGKIPRYIRNGQHRDVECITKSDKAGGFVRGIDIQASGKNLGLVGDNSDTSPVQSGKTDDDVLGKVFVRLKNLTIIDD